MVIPNRIVKAFTYSIRSVTNKKTQFCLQSTLLTHTKKYGGGGNELSLKYYCWSTHDHQLVIYFSKQHIKASVLHHYNRFILSIKIFSWRYYVINWINDSL